MRDDDHDKRARELIWATPAPQQSANPKPLNKAGRPRLPFTWFNDVAPNLAATDFVEGLLTAGGMSVVYGQSNCGKTFLVLDLALHVAWGREWHGRAVDQGAIVYLSLESAEGIKNRIAAFRTHHACAGLPFVTMTKLVDLLANDADVSAVIELTRYVAQETGLPVRMVIIDTLSRAMAGGNENSSDDMTALIRNCDRIRTITGSHVCIIHHSGKDEAKGARGHSSLRAATDTEIEIRRYPLLNCTVANVTKQRDIEAGQPLAFALLQVTLGTNPRGKPVTSCIVVEAENASPASPENKLTPKEREAWDVLFDLLQKAEADAENGEIGIVTKGVSTADWQTAWQQLVTNEGNKPDSLKAAFYRHKKNLIDKLNLEERDGRLFLGNKG